MNSALPDDPNSKLNACVNNVLRIWNDTKEQKLTPVDFLRYVYSQGGRFVQRL
jgi:hypothetical protein